MFESGAILVYLAEKTGKLLPASGHARYQALEWTFWQVGGLGPMLGQLGFFVGRSQTKPPEAIERFTTEAGRLFGVMEKRLGEAPYLAGDDYTIADIACYNWTLGAPSALQVVRIARLGRKAGHRALAEDRRRAPGGDPRLGDPAGLVRASTRLLTQPAQHDAVGGTQEGSSF